MHYYKYPTSYITTHKCFILATLIAGNTLNLSSAIIFICAVYFEVPELLFVGRLVCSIASSISFATLIIFLQVGFLIWLWGYEFLGQVEIYKMLVQSTLSNPDLKGPENLSGLERVEIKTLLKLGPKLDSG
jgi:hypothetical protein